MIFSEGKGERVPLAGQEAVDKETMGCRSGRRNLVLGKSKWCLKVIGLGHYSGSNNVRAVVVAGPERSAGHVYVEPG